MPLERFHEMERVNFSRYAHDRPPARAATQHWLSRKGGPIEHKPCPAFEGKPRFCRCQEVSQISGPLQSSAISRRQALNELAKRIQMRWFETVMQQRSVGKFLLNAVAP
ncbi:hypothetical protein [Caballeronia sp. SBC2]|uniref:hypothetical protein n=1 Tax=Caballeronia sp. SBC2 TaxID=2705547 RepID=UPI0019D181BB|nr:hypothetical protein [Caballeronia sp. SBC2]